MPQISKLRIVNFQYNDGKRLIADELFDFEGDKGPSDVLINLANGGGKSVLVQLMMQPVIPRAKVAGRRIESFFTRQSDHCYVVIEWTLDGSRMKLMTGIAMAASDAAGDADSDRGFHIKYYTFISSYPNYQGSYNIISLPLSRRENGRFIPAAFDEVRNMARRSSGGLERYASDDSVKWRERLAQYGIIQGEWRMIEELNSNEDGMSKYFSSLRTSDAVIDKLIVPRIEEKQSHSNSRDDSSLETMLISYARQFRRQQDIIRERGICAGFLDSLKEIREDAGKLWQDNDDLNRSIRDLFAYMDAASAAIAGKEAEAAGLAEESRRLGLDIRHIRHERASAEYYGCEERLEAESLGLGEAGEARDMAAEELAGAERRLRAIECARYYRRLRSVQSEIAAISRAITDREKDSEPAARLASLRYSALLAIEAELERARAEAAELAGHRDVLQAEAADAGKIVSRLERDAAEASAAVSRADAVYEKQTADDDRQCAELGIRAVRRLDGRYAEESLAEWEKETRGREASLAASIEDKNAERSGLEERRDAIPEELADAGMRLQSVLAEIKSLEDKLDVFRKVLEASDSVCDKHGFGCGREAAERAYDYALGKIEETDGRISREERRIEEADEALAAAARGTLHVPKMLTDFLNETGIRYMSFEKYILDQVEKGLITSGECRLMLEKWPYAAYAVIVSGKDALALSREAEDAWLPAVLPVLTEDDVRELLDGTLPDVSALAAYSKEYFNDPALYTLRLNEALRGRLEAKARLEERREDLKKDAERLGALLAYGEGFGEETAGALDALHKDQAELEALRASLQSELEEIREKIHAAAREAAGLTAELGDVRYLLTEYARWRAKLDEEDVLLKELDDAQDRLKKVKDEHKKKSREAEELASRLREVSDRLKEASELERSLQKSLDMVSGAPEAEVIEGGWEDLVDQYRTLMEAESRELKQLNDELGRLTERKDELSSEIRSRGSSPEEYEDLVWSDELEAGALERKKAADAAYRAADDVYNRAMVSHARAAASLENAEKQLAEYGGAALPAGEIGGDYDRRIADTNIRLDEVHAAERSASDAAGRLRLARNKAELAGERYARPAELVSIELEDGYEAQLDALIKRIRREEGSVSEGRRSVEGGLRRMADSYGSAAPDIGMAIRNMQELLSGRDIRGDRYYTLCEHMDANMHTAGLRIAQIDTDLAEFHRTRGDLIRQCVIQGRQMYEGLRQISANSRAMVQGKRKNMIKFDIPDAVDENIAEASIAAELEKGTREIADMMEDEDYADSAAARDRAKRIVGSKRLLRKYIGLDNIVLRAYKIDRNPDNSGYRTWEQTQVNNSGAEKFVVYFAVILAIMAYTRDGMNDIPGKDSRSVLVLDNPFGPISSKHVLEPMFGISRNYNVQMICLSDITKSDIVSCFDLVIRAVVKKLAFSSKEQLTHEGNEAIEHGFYRSEQINLLSR